MLESWREKPKSIRRTLRLFSYKFTYDFLLKKVVLKNVDLILPISNRMADQLEKAGLNRKKMFSLPLGVSSDLFKPTGINVRQLLFLSDDDFIFIYVGSISKIRGLNVIIKAFKDVVRFEKRAKLLFIGDGDDLNNLKKYVEDNNLQSNILFTGRVSYFDVPRYIFASDVGLSIIKPLPCYYVSSPCKLFEYMIMRKPVIANKEIPEHFEVINASKCGILVRYDEKDLANVMKNIIKLKKKS